MEFIGCCIECNRMEISSSLHHTKALQDKTVQWKKKVNKKKYTKTKDGNVTTRAGKIQTNSRTPTRINELFTILFRNKQQRHNLTTQTFSFIKESQLTTELTNKTIEKRIHDVVECSASCLLNGINHIWSEQIIAPSDVSDVAADDQYNDDEATRACLIIAQEQVMTDLVIAADCEDTGDEVNEDPTKLHKCCILNPWSDGAAVMRKMNYLEVNLVSGAHKEWKQSFNRFIISKVRAMKE